MSIKNTPIVHPQKFIRYLKETGRLKHERSPETVIFIFLIPLLNECKYKYNLIKIEGFDAGELYHLEDNPSIGIFCCGGIGAPVAVINIEELIAFGAKRFIVIGTAGSLQKDLGIGEITLCSEAIIDEGTSRHYISDQRSVRPSYEWHAKLLAYLRNQGISPKEGKSWTTDAPYRETIEKVIELQNEGVLSVEMEISALFTLAKFYEVDISSLFTISDSLANLEWSPGFFSEIVMKSLLSSIEHVISFAKQI